MALYITSVGTIQTNRKGITLEEKELKERKYSIFLDLTTQQLNLLKRARDLVIGNDKVDFVFADVNCRLTVKFKDGRFRFFDNFEELEKLIQE